MWNDVVKAVVTLLVALLSLATPYVAVLAQRHFKKDDLAKLIHYAYLAVTAAEQMSGRNNLTNQEKYDTAGTFLLQLADKAGISLTRQDVQPLLESAVHMISSLGSVPVSIGEQPGEIVAVLPAAAVIPPAAPAPVNSVMSDDLIQEMTARIATSIKRSLLEGLGTTA